MGRDGRQHHEEQENPLHGRVAVIAVQYEDGEVMQYIFDREG